MVFACVIIMIHKKMIDFPNVLHFWTAKNPLGHGLGRLDFLKVLYKGATDGMVVRTSSPLVTPKDQVASFVVILAPMLTPIL